MKFTLNRDKVVGGRHGHTIEFKKDVPVHVPKEMWNEVRAIGAVSEEEIVEPVPVGKVVPTEQVDRDAVLRPIMEQMAERNQRDDFGANGTPKLEIVSAAAEFKVTKKEVDILWAKIKLGSKDD